MEVFINLFILALMVVIFDIMIIFNNTNLYYIILQNHTF